MSIIEETYAVQESKVARWLKRGAGAQSRAEAEQKIRQAVESTLADIAEKGDAAVRGASITFDGWDRDSYELSESEKQSCLVSIPAKMTVHSG